jgi:integrase
MCFFLEGKKVRLSTKTSNKKVAQRIYDRTKWQIAEGTYNPNRKVEMPFSELVDEFLDKHSKVEKSSYKRDKVIGDALKKYFGRTPIGEISAYDIKEWRKWRMEHVTRKGTPIKKASVNRELAFLKTMFNLTVEWEWLDENPAGKIRLLKGETKRMRPLTRKEIDKLLSESPAHLKPMIIVALITGMRKGEILNLMKKHIDFDHGFIRVENSKNDASRDIPVDSYVLKILKELTGEKRSGDFVFCWKNGKRIKCVKEAFKAACERAGIEDFRFHDLRHTAASLLAAEGCDIITLKNILGHKTLAMTQRYAHLIQDRHEKIRQIMQTVWQSSDTVGDTVSERNEKPSLTN